MSIPESIVAAQLQNLLERLERYRDRRSAGELASAQERSHAILRNARSEARARLREAVAYERLRLTEALQRRRAEHDAEQRRQEHAALRELAQRAGELLPAELSRRWNEPAARAAWCEAALLVAARRLRGADWTIEIAPGTRSPEQASLLDRASELRAGKHSIRERRELEAGIRVLAAGAMLDAAAAGLLDNPAAIGSRVLREWLREATPVEAKVTTS